MAKLIGRRVFPNDDGNLELAQGDYGRLPDGDWLAWPPMSKDAVCLDLEELKEHSDGTISVDRVFESHDDESEVCWRGRLDHGVWSRV